MKIKKLMIDKVISKRGSLFVNGLPNIIDNEEYDH